MLPITDSKIKVINSTFSEKINTFVPWDLQGIQGNLHVGNLHYYSANYIRKNYPSYTIGKCEFAHLEEVLFWCEENFGNNWIWNWTTIYFKYEQDKSFFMLRWS